MVFKNKMQNKRGLYRKIDVAKVHNKENLEFSVSLIKFLNIIGVKKIVTYPNSII